VIFVSGTFKHKFSAPTFVLLGCMQFSFQVGFTQAFAYSNGKKQQSDETNGVLPAFAAATVKPVKNPRGILGFVSYPGGRVTIGNATFKMLMCYAFDVQEFELSGGPNWIDTDRYEIKAVPPDDSKSRTELQPPVQATPSDEQRKMLQDLLIERFNLKFHREMKEKQVYFLTKSGKALHLVNANNRDEDHRGGIAVSSDGTVDGEAFGVNVSMSFLARELSRYLERPVLDKTDLKETYDYHLDSDDLSNHDIVTAVFDVVDRLGLKLKKGRGQVETIVIDNVSKPTPD